VLPDSPASKAALRKTMSYTEINGQRVEGSAQFRRMIREILADATYSFPSGVTASSQNVTATLGKSQEATHHDEGYGRRASRFACRKCRRFLRFTISIGTAHASCRQTAARH